MRVLIDMNLSPLWVGFLVGHGVEAVHWSTIGDAKAPDTALMDWARENGHLVLTHVQAKDNLHPMGAGLQQGLDYSATLGIPFVFASNGHGFDFHDKTLNEGEGDIEKTLTLDAQAPPRRHCEGPFVPELA